MQSTRLLGWNKIRVEASWSIIALAKMLIQQKIGALEAQLEPLVFHGPKQGKTRLG